jgi:Asp-tRNA(Asn)/Glu-tRNA(Gln) amidotransferase B subunit
MGQLMKATKGKADPELANELIHEKIDVRKKEENL